MNTVADNPQQYSHLFIFLFWFLSFTGSIFPYLPLFPPSCCHQFPWRRLRGIIVALSVCVWWWWGGYIVHFHEKTEGGFGEEMGELEEGWWSASGREPVPESILLVFTLRTYQTRFIVWMELCVYERVFFFFGGWRKPGVWRAELVSWFLVLMYKCDLDWFILRSL